MRLVSICGSDVHLFKGDWQNISYPIRPGHEGMGIIDAVGFGVTHLEIGQRVVIEPNFPCGRCRYCWRGQGNICPNKRILGVKEPGCFAEYIVLPARFVWPIEDHIRDEDAVLVEPVAVGWHTLKTAELHAGETIAVIGLGAIGLLLTQTALAVGYKVMVLDKVPGKMALAEGWGAFPIHKELDDAFLGTQFDEAGVIAVFECGGTAKTAEMALDAAPPGAKVIIVGLAHKSVSFIPFEVTRRGIKILTSIIYDHPADFSRTIELIGDGVIQPSRIISYRCPFSQLPEALSQASNKLETKVVLSVTRQD